MQSVLAERLYGILGRVCTADLGSGILLKRIRGEPFPPSQFSLGGAGNIVNVIALAFLSVAWVFQFFPSAPDPTGTSMNW